MTTLDDDIRAFLQQPLVARMSTIGDDGYPHTVPVWFMLDGDDLVVFSVPGLRKLRNIAANPKGALCIGGDPAEKPAQYIPGYLFQGDFTIEDDPALVISKRVSRRYIPNPDESDRTVDGWGPMMAARLHIKRAIRVMG